jgi:hypothetical protein
VIHDRAHDVSGGDAAEHFFYRRAQQAIPAESAAASANDGH